MPHSINYHDYQKLDEHTKSCLINRTESDIGSFVEKVKPIIEAVKDQGDAALARFANEFDQSPVTADSIAATGDDFDRAFDAVDKNLIETIEFCSDNVRRFHQAQMPEQMWMKEMHPGVFAGEKVVPIESVACYVPRGKGSFPSVVMMTAIPAVVAGVKKPVIITPPGPDGKVDHATLVAAKIAGVEHVYKCGGAQGVAAVAYGTQTVPQCDKIVGPGSPWVVAAKRLLSDKLDPGIPAGPSEAIILADETANGKVAALDLLIESEHGPDSSAYLVTHSRRVADEALAAIPGYWKKMDVQRVDFSSAVLCGNHGGIILTESIEQSIAFVNEYAPEHLQIHAKSPHDYLGAIRNAGEILLGEHTPIVIGNFTLGPNAVLPTNAAARTHSPLGVHDYIKLVSIGYVTEKGYQHLAPHAHMLARYEGFDAHANAVSDMRTRAFAADSISEADE